MLASEQELKCFGKKEPKLEVDFVMKITKHQTWGDNWLFIKMFIALVVEQPQFSINDLQLRQAKLLI